MTTGKTCGNCRFYRTPKCSHAEDHRKYVDGIPLMTESDSCGDFYSKSSVEGSTNPYFNDEGHFQPVIFAKDLMKEHVFKTMRDNEDLFAFDAKKGIYRQNGETIIKEEMAKRLDEETRQRYYADVEFYVKASNLIDRLHQTRGAVAVENGILNLELRELTEFDPAYFITASMPVAYDPKATCQKIIKFLTEVVGEEQLPLTQETIGYCLLNSRPFHKATLLIGDGRNGKSTLLELTEAFLGKENVSNVSLQALCENRFASAQIYLKMANICADLPHTTLTHTGIFKMITGGDRITMENKFEKSFSDEPYAKLLFSTNQVPISLDDTTAFFSRWNLIVCNNAFTGEKCNPHILKEITTKEELSGLLNWALDGLDRLLKNGKFSTNDNIEDLRSEYIRKSNSAKAFIEENLEYDPDKNAIIIEIDLYEKYILYCKANKLPTMPKRNFTMNIQENLPQAKQTIERILGKNTHVWQYLKTATSATPAIIYGDKSNTSPEKGDQPEVAEVANSENVPISQTPLNPRLNKPEVAEVANSKESLLEVCKFCGKPIAGNIHDWIGENLDDPAHLECAEKWRELREIKP